MDDLERRLQAMSAVLDDLSISSQIDEDRDGDDDDIGDEWELAEEAPDRHAGTRRWLMVAAALVVVGSAGYVVGRQQEAPSAATTVSAPPTDAVVDECLSDNRVPDDGSYEVVVFPADDAGRTSVIAAGADEVVLCQFGRGSPVTSYSLPAAGDLPPAKSRSGILSAGWMRTPSSDPENHHSFFGRAGAVVTDVDAVFPDGTRIPGSVVDGWFMVEGGGPPDGGFDVTFEWTLRSRTQRRAAIESVDTNATTAERCAVVPGCVELQLERLQRQAEGTPQARELDDGEATNSELTAAVDRTVECLAEQGLDADWNGRQLDVHVGGIRTDDEQTVAHCEAEHLDLVREAFELDAARRRFDNDGPALGTSAGNVAPVAHRFDACTGIATPHASLRDLAEEHYATLCVDILQSLVVGSDADDPAALCRAGAPPDDILEPEQFAALCAHLEYLED